MTRNHGIRNLALAAGLAVGSSVLFAAQHAYAQKPKKPAAAAAAKDDGEKQKLADAKRHYGDGDVKFKAGDYAGALVEFQAADNIKPTPQAARYIGLCNDNLGHFQDAVTAYQRFLANVPAKMAAQGDEIRARVTAIQQLPGKVHVDSDPKGASVALDGRPQANATPTDVEVPTGHHTLHLTATGHDAVDKDVDVTFASHQDVLVTLPVSVAPPPVAVVALPPPEPAPAPPPPEPAPPAEKRSMAPAWITGGLAVVAAGVGTAFGIMALHDKSEFNKGPTESLADDGENKALVSDMAFGVAVTLGVTSAVLFLSHDDSAAPQAASAPQARRDQHPTGVSVTATPILTPHGGGAGALIRF
jgi:hypothetical protein